MQKIIIFIFIISNFTCFSQTKQWKLGVRFSPETYSKSSQISINEGVGYFLTPTSFNFTTGLSAQFILDPKLSISTGIAYSKRKFTGSYYCSSCDLKTATPILKNIKQEYLETPLLIHLNIIDKKLNLYLQGGILGNYLINETKINNSDKLSKDAFLLRNLIGCGMDINLSPRVNFNLTFNYIRSLDHVLTSTQIKLNSVSLQTGVDYCFYKKIK